MRRVFVIAVLFVLWAGWATWSLRAASSERTLGHPPAVATRATIAALRNQPRRFAGKTISLTGRMTDRCPTAGCWFYLHDETGGIRVEVDNGGFSVLGVPIGARLTAFGTVEQPPGEEPQLVAVGARL